MTCGEDGMSKKKVRRWSSLLPIGMAMCCYALSGANAFSGGNGAALASSHRRTVTAAAPSGAVQRPFGGYSAGGSPARTRRARASAAVDEIDDDGKIDDDGSDGGSSSVSSMRRRMAGASRLRPLAQLAVLLAAYVFHLTVLTQRSLVFPFQLFPNDSGHFQSIGLDSVAGIATLASFLYLTTTQHRRSDTALWKSPGPKTAPWFFPSNSSNKRQKRRTSPNNNTKLSALLSPRVTSTVALYILTMAYFSTGRIASMVELGLYALAGVGVPMTIAMHRSLVVLGGHLAWVAIGSFILATVVRPQPFFGGGYNWTTTTTNNNKQHRQLHTGSSLLVPSDNDSSSSSQITPKTQKNTLKTGKNNRSSQKYKWYTNKWNDNWLWWTIGGYFVSSWFFNIADFINHAVLPYQAFEHATEGVVSQLINPENNDLLASIVGYIAPCLTAPWWEEVLYRGYMLPTLCMHLPFWVGVIVSGIIFSAHHVSTTGAIPLAILGWTWATIYVKSGNLMVTILIHGMWNSRVFLGSWLGL